MPVVADVLDLARDHGIDYDVRFAADERTFREITRIERDLIEVVLRQAPWGYPLPKDQTATVNITAHDPTGYALPTGLWRIRGMRAVNAPWRAPIQLVDPVHANSVPQVHPSAWIEGNRIYPVAGVPAGGTAVNRRFGWEGITSIQVLHVTEPIQKTGVEQDIELHQDAVRVMAYELVNFFAKRGRTAATISAQIRQDAVTAREAWLAFAQTFPGPRAFPVV